jgi:hypothetical protein
MAVRGGKAADVRKDQPLVMKRDQGRSSAVRHASSPESLPEDHLEEDICVHIFAGSAAMVGVCLTVIGIVRIINRLKPIDTIGDDLLAVDALAYLGSCFLSYVALRTRNRARRRRLERVADVLFLSALTVMAAVCGLITYTIV